MASFNRVILIGNLTRDPELRRIPSGTAVTELSLAVNDRVKRNNEWVEEATFVDVTFWDRKAEVACEYLSKGRPVMIEGRLKLDKWEKDGQKFSKLRVLGERLEFIGDGKGGGGGGSGGRQSSSRSSGSSASDGESSYDDEYDYSDNSPATAPDDLPF